MRTVACTFTPCPKFGPPGSCTGQVQLYENGDYSGWAASFAAGDYPSDKLAANGAGNDETSSMKVPAGCIAILYQHSDYSGWFASFSAGDYPLADLVAKGVADDGVSSLKIIDAGHTLSCWCVSRMSCDACLQALM